MEEFSDFRAPLYEVKANLFKGLAHPVRIRVLELLCEAPEVSVTDILAATGLEASHLSQHLSVLRRYHLVKSERRALQMFYSLAYPQVADLLSVARHCSTTFCTPPASSSNIRRPRPRWLRLRAAHDEGPDRGPGASAGRRDYADLPRSWKGDLIAGVTVGIVALPLALAFGVSSGAGAPPD